jgi:hypothetical protein
MNSTQYFDIQYSIGMSLIHPLVNKPTAYTILYLLLFMLFYKSLYHMHFSLLPSTISIFLYTSSLTYYITYLRTRVLVLTYLL